MLTIYVQLALVMFALGVIVAQLDKIIKELRRRG